MIKLIVLLKSRSGGMADAQVSKTCDPKDHVGSTPSFGTNKFHSFSLLSTP